MLRLEEEDIYAGTATPSSGGGGSTPTVNVTNKSSSAISTGDKVWISPSGGSLEAIDFSSSTTGIPDSDIIGNVVISDSGIAVGFGSGSYIDIGELAMASANTWSLETEITTGNNISSPQNIFSEAYSLSSSCIQINNNKLQLNLRNPGSSSFLSYIVSSSTLSAKTKYKIKAEFTGTAYNLYIDDVSVGTYSSTTKLESISWAIGACPTGSYTYPFGGSLDTTKTSVKINGTQVFPKIVTTINITEDCYTGQAKEDIAINASGAVAVVVSPSPIQKGSFNSTTQQLTLYNSYITDKIQNSSLSDEAKTAYLTSIGDDDSVFDMTTDVSVDFGLENASFWAFLSSTNILITVDKTTPASMNFIVTEGSLNIADWVSFADVLSLEGMEMTPEQAQESFAEYVADESVLTTSGTLGNFSVEFN